MSTSVSTLINNLIEINLDAYKGYREAALGVNDLELKKIFNAYSMKRQRNSYDLKNQVHLLGDEPVNSGSIKATLHRAWMDFKSDVLTNESEVILEECIRGEEAAISTYEEVLDAAALPASIRTLVVSQLQDIEEAMRQMKEWKKLVKQEQKLDTE